MNKNYCTRCGKEIYSDLNFCPYCGAKQASSFSKEEIEKSPYKILQVSENAELEVIKAAYKSLSKKYHPDIDHAYSAQEKMKDINWAYSILSDPERRKEWDISYIRSKEQPGVSHSQKSTSSYSTNPRVNYQERYSKKYTSSQQEPQKTPARKQSASVSSKKESNQNKFLGMSCLAWIVLIMLVSIFLFVMFVGSTANSTAPRKSQINTSSPKNSNLISTQSKSPRQPTPTKTLRPPTPTSIFIPSRINPPYFEDFSNGSGNWYVGNDDDVSFTISDGKYIIKPKKPGEGFHAYGGANLDNIILEFSTEFLYSYPSADAGFYVLFRCENIDEQTCYTFFVTEDGYFSVYKKGKFISAERPSPFVNLYDHPNNWAIVMNGPDFEIHCNGELVVSFTDYLYKSGDFGFGADNSDSDEWGFNGVAFDNIRVSVLP